MTSGWCQSHGRVDQWHDVCEQRIADGFIASCDCPNHVKPLVDTGVSRPTTDRIRVAKSGPESAATDRGLRPDPAKEL